MLDKNISIERKTKNICQNIYLHDNLESKKAIELVQNFKEKNNNDNFDNILSENKNIPKSVYKNSDSIKMPNMDLLRIDDSDITRLINSTKSNDFKYSKELITNHYISPYGGENLKSVDMVHKTSINWLSHGKSDKKECLLLDKENNNKDSYNKVEYHDDFNKNFINEMRKKKFPLSNDSRNINYEHYCLKSDEIAEYHNSIKNKEEPEINFRVIKNSKLLYSYRLLREKNNLYYLTNKLDNSLRFLEATTNGINIFNNFILSENKNFFNWLIELIFSVYSIFTKEQNKNSSSINDAGKFNILYSKLFYKTEPIYILFKTYDKQQRHKAKIKNEIQDILFLGKKMFVQITRNLLIDFSPNDINKVVNHLITWATKMKTLRNIQSEEFDIYEYIFSLFFELFEALNKKFNFTSKGFMDNFDKIFDKKLCLEACNSNLNGNENLHKNES